MVIKQLPDDFDPSLIDDHSTLRPQARDALREAALLRAQRDRAWFLQTFWQVIDPEKMEWVPFKFRDYQIEDQAWFEDRFYNVPRTRNIVGKARQVGLTTHLAANIVGDTLFKSNHPWLVSSQTEGDAQETLGSRMKEPYLRLPGWLRERLPPLQNDNMETMEFANGSRILSIPATSKAGRSKVVFGVVMDEAAHADNAHEVFTALDFLCYGPLYVVSTGNGMGNFFHEKWVDSELHDTIWDNRFHPWWVVPGRDQKWYEREKLKYRGQMWRFFQEMPASPEEMFAKTGMAVLPMDLLKDQGHWCTPPERINLDLSLGEEEWHYLAEGEEADNELWVWEPPTVVRDDWGVVVQKPNYVIFADVAEGLSHGDRTSVVVMNANTYEEVASYRGWYPVEDLGHLLAVLGEWYHWALVMPERNNMGVVVVNDLSKIEHYPRLFRMPQLAQVPHGERTLRYGWVTTGPSKAKMVSDFTRALKSDIITLHDSRFLEEASTFIKDGKGGFNASSGNYDDHVIGHLGAWQGVLDVGQYPVIWVDHTDWKPVTWKDIISFSDDVIEGHPMDQPIGGNPLTEPRKTSFRF